METKLLKLATKIATPLSLASLVVLVLYLLFRTILTLPVFSQLAEGNTFLLLMAIINKLFVLALVGLVLGIGGYLLVQRKTHSSTFERRFIPRHSPDLRLPSGSRFTDAEFDAYRDVWVSLQNLRDAGEALWKHATKPNLKRFAQCLQDTQRKVASAGIFFQEDHHQELRLLLRHFDSYHGGKESLIVYLDSHPDAISPDGRHLDPFVRRKIATNRNDMVRYTELLEKLRADYYEHLRRPTEVA